ncbi:MAG: hypothetical protein J6A28_03345 [Clostridia bacterium]|nr:hypothetical protein [Clostridia bacterium]
MNVSRVAFKFQASNTTFTYNTQDRRGEITLSAVAAETIDYFKITEGDTYEKSLLEFAADWATISYANEMKNAGTYTVVCSVKEEVKDIFEIKNANDNGSYKFDVVINKFVVSGDLGVLVKKSYGETITAADLQAKYKVDATNEKIDLTFSGREEGTDVGSYDLYGPSTTNQNYDVSGATASLEIMALENIYFELKETLTYVYNGKKADSAQLSYNEEEEKYYFQIKSGSDVLASAEAWIGITTSTDVVAGERKDYAEGLEFTIQSPDANVGEYTITAAVGEELENAGWKNVEIIDTDNEINYTITKQNIEVSEIEKVFDFSENFDSSTTGHNATISGVVEGETIYVVGSFEDERVGEGKNISISLRGDTKDNYSIVGEAQKQGSIKPSSDELAVTTTASSFTYGNLTKDSEFKTLVPATFKVGNEDIQTYVTINSCVIKTSGGEEISAENISGAGYLKVAKYKVVYTYSCPEFGKENATAEFEISITKKTMAIEATQDITKSYDGTTALTCLGAVGTSDAPGTYYKSADLLAGDDVQVAGGSYSDSSLGEGKTITFSSFDGNDVENYNITTIMSGSGKIVEQMIELAKTHKSGEDFIEGNGGEFVSDGKTLALGANAQFSYSSIPATGAAAMNEIQKPTRYGYDFVGWKYFKDDQYKDLNEDNIISVLQDIGANDADKKIEIYPVWKLHEYTITFEGALSGIESTTMKYYLGQQQEVTATAERGYLFTNITINGTIVSAITGEGTNAVTITLSQITENVTITATNTEVQITVIFDPADPYGVLTENSTSTSGYTSLADIAIERPVTTEGTYLFDKWTYQSGGQTKTLSTIKEVVDELFTTLDSDKSVTLSGTWTAAPYIIFFDANGGEMTETTMEVKFNDELTNLPEATQDGKTFACWVGGEGDAQVNYTNGTRLQTIGTLNAASGKYEVTLKAKWTNNPYILTVKAEGVTLSVTDNNDTITIEDGQSHDFSIVFEGPKLTVNVAAPAGYGYIVTDDGEYSGEISISETSFEAWDLIADESITVSKDEKTNTLKINAPFIDSLTATIDDEEATVTQNGTVFEIQAKTDTIVKITLTAQAGYSIIDVTENVVANYLDKSDILNGNLTWSGFTQSGEITINTKANANVVTLGNIFEVLTDVTFQVDGEAEKTNINGGSYYSIETAKTLIIEGYVVYGYQNANLTVEDCNVTIFESSFDDAKKLYTFKATVSGFVDAFSLAFTKEAREYTFALAVLDADKENAEINSGCETKVVKFGEELNLDDCITIDRKYSVFGWVDKADNIVTEAGSNRIVITKDLIDLLESETPINIYPVLVLNMVEISVESEHGELVFYQAEGAAEDVTPDVRGAVSLFMDKEATLTIIANEGYTFASITFLNDDEEEMDDEAIQLQWIVEGSQLSFTAYDNIYKIIAEFTATCNTVHVQAGVNIAGVIRTPSAVGGKIYRIDENGNKMDESAYIRPEGVGEDAEFIGINYITQINTGEVLRFIVEREDGFEIMIEFDQGAANSNLSSGNNGSVYSVYGITGELYVYANFIAKTQRVEVAMATVDIVKDEGEDVYSLHEINAGRVIINTSDEVAALSNNQHFVQGSVIEGRKFTFSTRTRLGYQFYADPQTNMGMYIVKNEITGVYTKYYVQIDTLDWETTGFNQSMSIELDDIANYTSVYVAVVPKTYTVNLINKVGTEETLLATTKVTFGQSIILSGVGVEALQPEPYEQQYQFNGYWTKENSQRVQYVDEKGSPSNIWQESGYVFNGEQFVPQPNFSLDENGEGVFDLYVGWKLKKAEIFINFPYGINLGKGNNIASVVVNDEYDGVPEEEMVQLWISQNNDLRAEVYWGSELQVLAPVFEGYQFSCLQVEHEGGETVVYTEQGINKLAPVDEGKYTITFIYNPKFEITIASKNSTGTSGGESWIEQDGKKLGASGAFDYTKKIKVYAVPAEGYNFVYWQNVITGQIYSDYEFNGQEYVYSFRSEIRTELKLQAVFEGKTVVVNVDNDMLLEYHEIIAISTNSSSVTATAKSFNSRIGDRVEIIIRKNKGYTFEPIGGEFEREINEDGDYVLSCLLSIDNVAALDGSTYKLDLSFNVDKEKIMIKVEKILLDTANSEISEEISRVGIVKFVSASGAEREIISSSLFTTFYGNTTAIKTDVWEFYKIKRILLISGDERVDLLPRMVGGRLELTVDIIDRYFSKNITVRVEFERQVWTMEEYRSSALAGEGTKESPFLIRDAEDMAFVAYLINNNRLINGIAANKAHYKVVASIDFAGKYWQAIGNEDAAFEGVFDLGGYRFENIVHYEQYQSPNASYGGLFWKISDEAEIITSDRTMTTWIIIASCMVGCLGLVMGIIAIRRSKRGKYIH